jgi:hypothetical protein
MEIGGEFQTVRFAPGESAAGIHWIW